MLASKLPPLILLCGGKSSRMKTPKGLLKINNSPWIIDHMINFSKAGGNSLIVVLGFQNEEYLASLPILKESLNNWVNPFKDQKKSFYFQTVINENPAIGQFSSLICGLKKGLNFKEVKGAFISTIDTPSPEKTLWNKLLRGFTSEKRASIPIFNERGGHPVLLSIDFIKEIVNIDPLSEDARLDFLLKKLPPDKINKIKTNDPKISQNINNKEDFKSYFDE